MRVTKQVQVPATTHTVLEKTVCDLCGNRIPQPMQPNAEEVTVSHRTGHYGDYACGHLITYDLCRGCFHGKLMPWLKSQGAEPTEEEWEN